MGQSEDAVTAPDGDVQRTLSRYSILIYPVFVSNIRVSKKQTGFFDGEFVSLEFDATTINNVVL